jgi:hypothetical protein
MRGTPTSRLVLDISSSLLPLLTTSLHLVHYPSLTHPLSTAAMHISRVSIVGRRIVGLSHKFALDSRVSHQVRSAI